MPITRALNMRCIDAKIIRGGSSKGVFLDIRDLPEAGPERDEVVLGVFGSPDRRQIDGLGGADKLTSKVAVMGPPTRDDCDIDYLFGQVNTELPRIDWSSNCGNISSGAALYGALEGVGQDMGDHFIINVHQVNTGRKLVTRVPVENGSAQVDGDFAIGGVPGTGARIDVDFGEFAGSALGGEVLPTGNACDTIEVPGIGSIDVSIVDMANLHIFVRASDIGLPTDQSIYDLQADVELVGRLEAVRKAVAAHIGFITGPNADEELKVSMNPLIFAVAPPCDYVSNNGTLVKASDYDLFSRSLSRFEFSKAYPGSGAAGTSVAAGIPGNLAADAAGDIGQSNGVFAIRVGHPGGVLEVAAEVDTSAGIKVSKALIGRTARLLMEGKAYFK
ncbi:PrpF domain-containing protein [uncultured Cohaesibacter sp.]|uniref:PrpF domain-containing protein n=1 Tax=uncultured Cohaesibacter sp. TaxID=1002546 RepID=UPI0029C6B8C3|nr:PrpF domain-containing protein [uncultured Cohaesibacter sp.]